MRLEMISRQPDSQSHPTPLLFVHGAWHGAWAWEDHFLPYFAEHGYSVHALSLRGHAGSEGRERFRFWRIRDYVADVKQVADTLPSSPVVIGHSMGGFTVQKYLEKYAAPAGVLIASAPPAGVLRTSLQLLLHHPLTFLKVNLLLNLYPAVATPALAREMLFSSTTPDDSVQRVHARLQDESYLAYMDMLLLDLPRPARIKTPMFVLGATDDGIFTPAEVNATARAYNTTATLIPHTGHNMMLESSWKTSADHILTWLSERGL